MCWVVDHFLNEKRELLDSMYVKNSLAVCGFFYSLTVKSWEERGQY